MEKVDDVKWVNEVSDEEVTVEEYANGYAIHLHKDDGKHMIAWVSLPQYAVREIKEWMDDHPEGDPQDHYDCIEAYYDPQTISYDDG